MTEPTESTFDAASGLAQGSRDHQEDAVIADFPVGAETGLVVLSDGMGGHAAGDVASKIVMTEVFCELKFQSGKTDAFEDDASAVLQDALFGANECLAAHIAEHPESQGMGATLVAVVFRKNRMNWVSVGDSPLYLYRGGVLRQLNEDHSMAPQIDLMADTGLIDSATARDHPDRNALTSVLGGNEISRIDCPEEPFMLEDGDVVIAASDGLQFVDDNQIASILAANRGATSAELARIFLGEIDRLDDPEQDNTSMVVVRVGSSAAEDSLTDALRSALDFAQVFDASDDTPVPPAPATPEPEIAKPAAPPAAPAAVEGDIDREVLAAILADQDEVETPEIEEDPEPAFAMPDLTDGPDTETPADDDIPNLLATAAADEDEDEAEDAPAENVFDDGAETPDLVEDSDDTSLLTAEAEEDSGHRRSRRDL